MQKEHVQFIDSADEKQLRRVRKELEELLEILKEREVRRDAQALCRAIDQELLERVMRRNRLAVQAPDTPETAKAA